MSLIKLFNMNFFRQNIKKSKGLLGIFLILVPLANFLMVFLSSLTTNKAIIFQTEEFMVFNILGMYIIPIVISVALFGYVYKKTSVDFVNSMPLSRKTIFITNAIGGILLIIGMQLLNLLIMLLSKLLFNNIVIYPQMMFEIFMEMTISYIFVYMITNIAMSLSGNIITQIVVTALIAFMVPFVTHMSNVLYLEKEAVLDVNGIEIEGEISQNIQYTLPYGIIGNTTNNNFETLINYRLILRTLILSIIYFIIGKILFEKRKMENTEESFQSEHIHSVVKLLTLVPVAFLFEYTKDTSIAINIIIITLTIIYWFLYDLITRKKVKFTTSVVYLILGTILLQTTVHVICDINKNKKDDIENIKFNDIAGISLDETYYIEDKEIIKEILGTNNTETKNIGGRVIYVKLKDGRTFTDYRMRDLKLEELEDKLYKENLRSATQKYKIMELNGKILTEKQTKEIKQEIIKYIDNNETSTYQISQYFYLVGYEEHQIKRKPISISTNNEIFKKMTKILNEDAKETLNNSEEKINSIRYELNGTNNSKRLTYNSDILKLKEYINNHYEEECSMEKPYYIFTSTDIKFFTNNVEDIEKLLQ